MNGCEVMDWVRLGTTEVLIYRTVNEAANVELERRGTPELGAPSGELEGDAIVWINTCGGIVVEEGTLPVP
jgi:hypothetical protein